MKNLNKILTSVFVLCLFLGFTACTEEVEYSPAEVPTGAQIYFPNTLASKLDISLVKTSFDVEIMRIDTKGALSVNLTSTADASIFTVPGSVSFADGKNTAIVTINYDPDKLTINDYKAIKLTIADENQITPYGPSAYSFTAGVPLVWTSLGNGTLNSVFFEDEWEVEIQTVEGSNMYRLIDPYYTGYNIEFTLKDDGTIDTFADQNIGYYYSSTYGYVWARYVSSQRTGNVLAIEVKYILPTGGVSFSGTFIETITFP